MTNNTLLLLPGDGIGQEIARAATQVIDALNQSQRTAIEVRTADFGGTAYDRTGSPLPPATLDAAMDADAVLMGAVGGPQWDDVPRALRPEAGLLGLRKAMDVFANLRPAVCFPALAASSSLKQELVEGLDLMIVRELTAGVYFGTPRGHDPENNRVIDTQSYTQAEIERVARVAFDLARARGGKLHSVEKANVMETGAFWRKVVTDLHAKEGAGIELHHMYADNCAMQLVRAPKQFDVIVTDNLFGDLLSDCAAMLTGSLGMLPSASLSSPDPTTGRRRALYEPVHGSAPDIAGQDKANPCAMLASLSMALRYSFAGADAADVLDGAIARVLADNVRTQDIANDASTVVGCTAMTQHIIAQL